MASRCAWVIRGTNTPFVVDFTSSSAEAAGAPVPMPTFPVSGNVFCAERFSCENNTNDSAHASRFRFFFIKKIIGYFIFYEVARLLVK
jgi:hypothetical protein